MNDPNRSYDDGHTARPAPGNTMANYQITPEELKVLDECNWESLTRRSVPFGTALGVSTYLGVQRGILRPNARFGASPKVTMAVLVGYFIGKLSYHRECAEKFMALPNSRIGQILRDLKEGKTTATQPITMFGVRQEDIYSDAGPGSSLDLDTDRPNFNTGDDPPNFGAALGNPDPHKPLSYEELRIKNREKYTDARQNPYKVEPPSSLDSFGPPPPVVRSEPRATRPGSRTNQYGDPLD